MLKVPLTFFQLTTKLFACFSQFYMTIRLWQDFSAFRPTNWSKVWLRAKCRRAATSFRSRTAFRRVGSRSTRWPWASTRGCSTTSSAASTSCSPSAGWSTEKARPSGSSTSSDLSVSKTKIRLNRSLPVFKIETISHTIENNKDQQNNLLLYRNKTYKSQKDRKLVLKQWL